MVSIAVLKFGFQIIKKFPRFVKVFFVLCTNESSNLKFNQRRFAVAQYTFCKIVLVLKEQAVSYPTQFYKFVAEFT